MQIVFANRQLCGNDNSIYQNLKKYKTLNTYDKLLYYLSQVYIHRLTNKSNTKILTANASVYVGMHLKMASILWNNIFKIPLEVK